MDYEKLYQQIQVFEKSLKDKNTSIQKYIKSLNKNSESGDIKSSVRDLTQLQSLNAEINAILNEYKELVESFNTTEYLESGDYSEQMLYYCKQYKVDVKGDYPVFEIFPFKVKLEAENSDIIVNNKKIPCLRPLNFVKYIKERQDKLFKAPFNATGFVNELAECYDRAISIKRLDHPDLAKDSDYSLRDLYTFLAPMQRYRREYDMQSYAFDLGRLVSMEDELEITKDGRRYQLGPSRFQKKNIRILDANGVEYLLGEIRFFHAKGDEQEHPTN